MKNFVLACAVALAAFLTAAHADAQGFRGPGPKIFNDRQNNAQRDDDRNVGEHFRNQQRRDDDRDRNRSQSRRGPRIYFGPAPYYSPYYRPYPYYYDPRFDPRLRDDRYFYYNNGNFGFGIRIR